MFIFRVATRLGIGHLMRMKWLAKVLIQRKKKVIFVIDECHPLVVERISDLACDVHQINISSDTYNDVVDATFCAKVMKENDCQQVIIDNYWLSATFERHLYQLGYQVNVFDDIEREHVCHRLFDQKWQGPRTSSRYQHLVNTTCKRYLGPNYCILAPEYYQLAQAANTPNNDDKKTILFSLGGGGDLTIIANIIKAIIENVDQGQLVYRVVVGPQAQNVKCIKQLAEHVQELSVTDKPQTLSLYYQQADFFVGALGTSLYELAVTQLPALTFSIEDNQLNDINDLEDLGHYFHLNQIEVADSKRVGNAIVTLLKNIERVKKLRSSPLITIDAMGSQRIADIILGSDKKVVNGSPTIKHHENWQHLTENISMREVDDRDINHYLSARNLPNNANRMTITQDISSLDHYQWWFNNSRKSYLLSEHGERRLYIWHDLHINKKTNGADASQYLYGGWFTAGDDVAFNLAMLALKWQLTTTQKQYPNATWLAVIHKDNKFVNLLNTYMGFKATANNAIEHKITQALFPHATQQDFNYVHLRCQDITH